MKIKSQIFTHDNRSINTNLVQEGNAAVYSQYLKGCSPQLQQSLLGAETSAKGDGWVYRVKIIHLCRGSFANVGTVLQQPRNQDHNLNPDPKKTATLHIPIFASLPTPQI